MLHQPCDAQRAADQEQQEAGAEQRVAQVDLLPLLLGHAADAPRPAPRPEGSRLSAPPAIIQPSGRAPGLAG
eukprot:6880688-Pyramimonas_sp.AAC.1